MIIVAQYAQELFVSQILAILLSSMLGVMAKIGTKIDSRLKKNIEEDESC